MPLRLVKDIRFCLLGSVFLSATASADLDFLNIQLLEPTNDVLVAAEYSYFDLSLDFLDFASKVNSSSTPEQSTSTQLSLLIPLSDQLRIGYEFKNYSALVSRAVEPFVLESEGNQHRLSVNYHIGYLGEMGLFINLSAAMVKQDSLEIDCYAHAGLVLGGSCDSADIRLLDGDAYINTGETNYYPAMTVDGNAKVYRLGAELRGRILDRLPFYQKFEFQSARIDLSYSSRLLQINDQALLNASYRGIELGSTINNLASQLPQQTPWTERAVIIEFGSRLQLADTISASMAIKHYRIDRANYEYGASETNYNNNTALNLGLWFEPNSDFMAYIRGQVSQYNLLGMDPLAYNRKTSKFFDQPYGQISAGITYSF